MKNKPKSNWRIIAFLLVFGAVPSVPGAFLLNAILQGPLPDGVPNNFVSMHYFKIPFPITLHIVVGILFSILVPFQFSSVIRWRWRTWHRWSGCVVIILGLLIAFSALWMIHFFPATGGFSRYSGLFVTSVGVMISFIVALHAILIHNIQRHRAWMMRAIAITFGASAPAVFLIPVFLIYGELGEFVTEWSRWFGMLLNLAMVEWVLRHERRPIQDASVLALGGSRSWTPTLSHRPKPPL